MKNSLLPSVLLLALAACLLPGQAHAQATPLSRAEVKAEFLRARAAGELPSSADLFGPALQQAMQATHTKQAVASSTKAKEADQRSVLALPQSAASATQR
ncbi:MAG: hypothetical protein RIS44_2018 [Pseudomonadota bacterium]|jgi:hypothetical protein